VTFSQHKRHAIENLAEDSCLSRESREPIAAALDFKPVEAAVHYDEIDSCQTVPKAQFLDHESICCLSVLNLEAALQRFSEATLLCQRLFWRE